MPQNSEKRRTKWYEKVLKCLTEDPTKSPHQMAKDLGTYRQLIWRMRRNLEKDKVIWGYTAVVDERKLNHVMYVILMKLGPMTRDLAQLIIERMVTRAPNKQNVRLLNVLYVNGEFDLLVMFTAPDHASARRYFDSLRIAYQEFLVERPIIVDVNFPIIREGKVNPELKKLHDFVPV